MEVIALGALEFSSIAIGILALDEMVKIAPVKIIEARFIKSINLMDRDITCVEIIF